jgi:hypothetical protein
MFKLGKQNAAVDALSRHGAEPPEVVALSVPGFELYDQLRSEATSLPVFIDKRAAIAASTADLGWSIIDDVILFKDCIFLPSDSGCWLVVL